MALPKIDIEGASDAMREIRDAILGLDSVEGSGVLQVERTPQGKRLTKAGDGTRMVQLTNNANPYTAVEVFATSSGGWTAYPSSLTFTGIYEDNLQNGLLDRVVEISPGYQSDWRFNYVRYGDKKCKCCLPDGCNCVGGIVVHGSFVFDDITRPCGTTLTFSVSGPGGSSSITHPIPFGTSVDFVFTGLGAGTYTVAVVPSVATCTCHSTTPATVTLSGPFSCSAEFFLGIGVCNNPPACWIHCPGTPVGSVSCTVAC